MDPLEEDVAWFKSTFHPIPKPTLPDDCIEYSLYVIDTSLDEKVDSELRLRLREVQKYANDLQKNWLSDYIWQRQSFALEFVKEDGLSCLRGRTEYGDSIEDEWAIVWLLRELTKKFDTAWAKVTDSDGEFLLIEASGTLPAWLEPDVAENRVWINDGQLKIIKPSSSSRSSKRTEEKISLKDAQQIILSEPKRLMHSMAIEDEAFYRLRNYPGQIKENNHHALITIPRKIAYLLLQNRAYMAPAIEAFYLRDPIALKPLQVKEEGGNLTFPPVDLVTLSGRFPKVAYAQVKSQEFPAPAAWKSKMPIPGDDAATAAAETGMKVSCGFEMLLTDNHYQDRPAVREMKLLLEDVESGDAFLPTDEELSKLNKTVDDEKWLDIDFDDLQQELGGRNKEAAGGKKREFGDKSAQENLQRLVKQFEEFLNDDAGDGMLGQDSDDDEDLEDLDTEDSDDGEDKEASFGEDEFSKLMQEMMGMPPEVMKELMSGKIDAMANGTAPAAPLAPSSSSTKGKVTELDNSGSDEEPDEDGEHIQNIMRQMESELRGSGALDLGPTSSSKAASKHALKDTNVADEGADSSDDDDDLDDVDADFARNLLESFRSQGGKAGPTTTLMDLMNQQRGGGDGKGKGKPSQPGPSKRK